MLSLIGGTAGGQDGLILHVRVVLGLSDGTTRGVICSRAGVPDAGGGLTSRGKRLHNRGGLIGTHLFGSAEGEGGDHW